MDIITNPVIIGLLVGAATFGYLSWDCCNKNEQNKKKIKKGKMNPEEVNLLIPLIVTIIAWFIAYAYFEYNPAKQFIVPHQIQSGIVPIGEQMDRVGRTALPLPIPPRQEHLFVRDVISESSDPSFSIIQSGTIIPRELPDVLLELH